MDKWADYLVSGVKTPDPKYIDSVECHSDFGCVVCENMILSRTGPNRKHKEGLYLCNSF